MLSQPAEKDRSSPDPPRGGMAGPFATRPTPRYRRVLVVQDAAAFRRIIVRNLASRGVGVREVQTVDQAVAAVAKERPDLLLLDVNLPDRSGWGVLRELRRCGIELPTVVVSAVRVPASRLEEFRPLAYFPKLSPLEALLRLVVGVDGDEPAGETAR